MPDSHARLPVRPSSRPGNLSDPTPAACPNIWTRWIPDLVVEVVRKGGEKRDYEEKAGEYLRAGVREYWIVDPIKRRVLIHQRVGNIWARKSVAEPAGFRTGLLPGLTVSVGALLGPAGKRGR